MACLRQCVPGGGRGTGRGRSRGWATRRPLTGPVPRLGAVVDCVKEATDVGAVSAGWWWWVVDDLDM